MFTLQSPTVLIEKLGRGQQKRTVQQAALYCTARRYNHQWTLTFIVSFIKIGLFADSYISYAEKHIYIYRVCVTGIGCMWAAGPLLTHKNDIYTNYHRLLNEGAQLYYTTTNKSIVCSCHFIIICRLTCVFVESAQSFEKNFARM